MKNFKWNTDEGQFQYIGDLTKNTIYLIRTADKVVYWYDKSLDQYTLVLVNVNGDIVEHFDSEGELAVYLKQRDLLD